MLQHFLFTCDILKLIILYYYLYIVDYFYHTLLPEKNYLTAASKLPVLNSTLAFEGYYYDDDGRLLPILGINTMTIKNGVVMFTFNNHIYVGEIGKVYLFLSENHIVNSSVYNIDIRFNTI